VQDCWVTLFGKVYDLTRLLAAGHGTLAEPLLEAAGGDVTHWFTRGADGAIAVKTFCDPATNLTSPYTPQGRFIHVPLMAPSSAQGDDFQAPWWAPDSGFVVGLLSAAPRRVRIINTLTSHDHVVEFGAENSVEDMQARYVEYNGHCGSYTWKALKDGVFRPLDVSKTLAAQGVGDDAEELARLGLDADHPDFLPTLVIAFNDDLTVA
jgi:hypothetical protein